MATLLSTKILAENQKQLILNSGIGLVEYDAISIGFDNSSLDAPIPRNLIFTSQNGVKGFFTQYPEFQTRELNIFCVGEKTKLEIEKNGYSVDASILTKIFPSSISRASTRVSFLSSNLD